RRPWLRDAQVLALRGLSAVLKARAGQLSRIATTPWPPAAQIEIRPRLPGPPDASSWASVATMRPPVAANGCPAASDDPLTLSLDLSMLPSALSRPSRSLQYSSDSHAVR